MSDDRYEDGYEEGYEEGLKDGWDGGREEAMNDFRDDDGASIDGIKMMAYQDGYQEGYRTAIRSECAAGQWQSMSEKMPPENEVVLIKFKNDFHDRYDIAIRNGDQMRVDKLVAYYDYDRNEIEAWARINTQEETNK